VMILV